MKKKNVKWHMLTAGSAVTQLHTNAACGLSRKAARSRYRKFGANTLFDPVKDQREQSMRKAFLLDPALLLLLLLLLFSLLFSAIGSTLMSVAVLLCALLPTIQITRRLIALRQTVNAYRTPTALVLREGRVYEISARGVVAGDILFFRKGDIVPCDCRLLETDGELCARLVFLDENGKRTALEQMKDPDVQYAYGEAVYAPSCANMLYGKSEILRGSARAVAVETGDYTFIGALGQGRQPRQDASERSLFGMLPPIRMYSGLLIALLIPLSLIGLFTAPEEYSVLRVFMPLCALCAVGAQSVLTFLFRVLTSNGHQKCIKPSDNAQNRSISKSADVLEKLSGTGEIVVIGKCASSDGMMHLHRVALGDGEVSLSSALQPSLRSICEAYELLWSAPAATPYEQIQTCRLRDVEAPTVRDELCRISQFDRTALQIRRERATAHYREDGILLDVAFREGEVQFGFTDRAAALYSCTGYEKDGRVYPLDGQMRESLLAFASEVAAEGGKVTVVIRSMGGRTVLLGVLSCREQVQPQLPSVLEELSRSGVRVTFFLQDEGNDTALYIKNAKLPRTVLFAKDVENDTQIEKYYGKYRVFVGFSMRSIKAAVRALRRAGNRVAVLSSDLESLGVQAEADLQIAADPILQIASHAEGNGTEPRECGFLDSVGCRILSARAQILIPPANARGGGLASCLHALMTSRATWMRMRLLFRYLFAVSILRLVTVGLFTLTGIGTPSTAQILFLGWIFDLFALLRIMICRFSPRELHRASTFDPAECKKTAGEKQAWLSPCLSAVGVWLFAFVLSLLGKMSAVNAGSYLFFSVLLVQAVILLRTVYSVQASKNVKADLFCLITLPLAAICELLSCLVPEIAAVTELASLTVFGYIALLLGPCLLLVINRILTEREKKKTKPDAD